MTYERSLKAVDAAIAFGEGEISREELDKAARAAYYAADAAADAAARAADTAFAAADAASYAATAAAAAAAAHYAPATAAAFATAAAAAAGYEENRKLTADICRKYLPIEVWNIKP